MHLADFKDLKSYESKNHFYAEKLLDWANTQSLLWVAKSHLAVKIKNDYRQKRSRYLADAPHTLSPRGSVLKQGLDRKRLEVVEQIQKHFRLESLCCLFSKLDNSIISKI